MQWDGDGIQICEHSTKEFGKSDPFVSGIFNRADIPDDINALQPDPTGWRLPDAAFAASGCDPYSEPFHV